MCDRAARFTDPRCPVKISVPRDWDGSFEPKIVKKRQRRLPGVDEMVISLAAKGLTTGEVQAHLAEVYGTGVSRQIRKVICSTNAIESVNARIRKAVRARGHFPNEAAALKCVYMALMSLDPTGKGRKRWTIRWKAPLDAFQIAFEGRLAPAND
ncbi:transposase [Streptomyces sp. NBC_01217]|nr:transposase [Streptomyces sp. NBC_01217]WSQ63050.1 transposase [Streptomyces sp. NBC_01217]